MLLFATNGQDSQPLPISDLKNSPSSNIVNSSMMIYNRGVLSLWGHFVKTPMDGIMRRAFFGVSERDLKKTKESRATAFFCSLWRPGWTLARVTRCTGTGPPSTGQPWQITWSSCRSTEYNTLLYKFWRISLYVTEYRIGIRGTYGT